MLTYIHRSFNALNYSIMKILALLSFIIHLTSATLIAYQKKKYQEEDNTVYIIRIPPNSSRSGSVSNGNNAMYNSQKTNTKRYNPILFQLENIIFVSITLALFLAMTIVSTRYVNHLSDYAREFLPGMMFSFIFPCIFYLRNANFRKFIVSCFVSR